MNKKKNLLVGDFEIPKHKKKKQSAVSKAKNKSAHKHMYKPCLFVDKKGFYNKSEYCTLCGKVGEISLGTERVTGNCYRQLTNKEIYETYKQLELVEIEEIIPKYLPIRRTEEK